MLSYHLIYIILYSLNLSMVILIGNGNTQWLVNDGLNSIHPNR